jgi:hypothetical protein
VFVHGLLVLCAAKQLPTLVEGGSKEKEQENAQAVQ